MTSQHIIVGVDESEGAAAALRWAAAEAQLRDAELTAVLAWGFIDQHHPVTADGFNASYGPDDALRALRGFITAALGAEASASVRALAACELPARALLDASQSADLLVVGARGLGGFRGLLLGSVSQHCLHHATVPIAIIRARFEPAAGGGRVLVGVDGSAAAQRALRWAIHEARRRRAHLDVVTAWDLPYVAGSLAPTPVFDSAAFETGAKELVEQAISAEDISGLAHPICPIAVHGSPTTVLLARAAGVDLLVVGSRGHSALKRALIGSVATQVSHHAPCPTVVVPSEIEHSG